MTKVLFSVILVSIFSLELIVGYAAGSLVFLYLINYCIYY